MFKMAVLITALLGLLAAFPIHLQAESPVTVSGVVSEDGQLIGSDGIIYEIAENEIGLQLMEMTDNRVIVQGQVLVVDEAVIIVVVKFEKHRK